MILMIIELNLFCICLLSFQSIYNLINLYKHGFKNYYSNWSRLKKKPKYILMENVKGFDEGEARSIFVGMLKSQNYFFQVCINQFFLYL